MFSLLRPTPHKLRLVQERLAYEPLTYVAADGRPPRGFVESKARVSLGRGRQAFDAARRAVAEWRMFPARMSTVYPDRPPIKAGQIVSVLFRAGPLWTTNPCRILKVIDDGAGSNGDASHYGFVYGTLRGHVARGEERFLVEWNRATDEVTYSIDVFSRPAHWLIWLGYPYARWQQHRFRRLSGLSMQAAVKGVGST